MDRTIAGPFVDVFERAFLFDDPDAGAADLGTPPTCPECMLPVNDDADPDPTHCAWCGARNPEPLQAVMWAELKAIELAWPEMLEA